MTTDLVADQEPPESKENWAVRKKQQKGGEVGGFERWLEGRPIVLGC